MCSTCLVLLCAGSTSPRQVVIPHARCPVVSRLRAHMVLAPGARLRAKPRQRHHVGPLSGPTGDHRAGRSGHPRHRAGTLDAPDERTTSADHGVAVEVCPRPPRTLPAHPATPAGPRCQRPGRLPARTRADSLVPRHLPRHHRLLQQPAHQRNARRRPGQLIPAGSSRRCSTHGLCGHVRRRPARPDREPERR